MTNLSSSLKIFSMREVKSGFMILLLSSHPNATMADRLSAIMLVIITRFVYRPSISFMISLMIPVMPKRAIRYHVFFRVSSLKMGMGSSPAVKITKMVWGTSRNTIKKMIMNEMPKMGSLFGISSLLLGTGGKSSSFIGTLSFISL